MHSGVSVSGHYRGKLSETQRALRRKVPSAETIRSRGELRNYYSAAETVVSSAAKFAAADAQHRVSPLVPVDGNSPLVEIAMNSGVSMHISRGDKLGDRAKKNVEYSPTRNAKLFFSRTRRTSEVNRSSALYCTIIARYAHTRTALNCTIMFSAI